MNHGTFGSMIRVAREGTVVIATLVALLGTSTVSAATVPLPVPAGAGHGGGVSTPPIAPTGNGSTGGILSGLLGLLGWGSLFGGSSGGTGMGVGLGTGILSGIGNLWNNLKSAWANSDIGGILTDLGGFFLLGAGIYGMLKGGLGGLFGNGTGGVLGGGSNGGVASGGMPTAPGSNVGRNTPTGPSAGHPGLAQGANPIDRGREHGGVTR